MGRLAGARSRSVRLDDTRLARRRKGFDVRVETSTAAFADPAIHDLSLIVPIYTMSKIEKAGGAQSLRRGARRRRARRPSRRHVRCVPRLGRLPVPVRRPVGRASRQHHRLQGRRDQAGRSDHGGHRKLRAPLRAVLHACRPGERGAGDDDVLRRARALDRGRGDAGGLEEALWRGPGVLFLARPSRLRARRAGDQDRS